MGLFVCWWVGWAAGLFVLWMGGGWANGRADERVHTCTDRRMDARKNAQTYGHTKGRTRMSTQRSMHRRTDRHARLLETEGDAEIGRKSEQTDRSRTDAGTYRHFQARLPTDLPAHPLSTCPLALRAACVCTHTHTPACKHAHTRGWAGNVMSSTGWEAVTDKAQINSAQVCAEGMRIDVYVHENRHA